MTPADLQPEPAGLTFREARARKRAGLPNPEFDAWLDANPALSRYLADISKHLRAFRAVDRRLSAWQRRKYAHLTLAQVQCVLREQSRPGTGAQRPDARPREHHSPAHRDRGPPADDDPPSPAVLAAIQKRWPGRRLCDALRDGHRCNRPTERGGSGHGWRHQCGGCRIRAWRAAG